MPILLGKMTNLYRIAKDHFNNKIYNLRMFIIKKVNQFIEFKSLRREYLKIIFIYNPIICLILNLDSKLNYHFLESYLYSYLVSFICASLCIFFSYLILKFSKKSINENFKYFLVIQIILLLPLLFISLQLTNTIFEHFFSIKADDSFYNLTVASSAYIILIFLSLFVVDKIRILKIQKQEQQILVQQLEIKNLNAKLQSLNQQLNPHFLFNSLNTLSSAINLSPELAEKMSLQLGHLYRNLLEASKHSLNSLKNEIEICELYLGIEKIRFSDRLKYSLQVDSNLFTENFMLPSLTLHTLVENAMKHGISQLLEGGEIMIQIENKSSTHVFIKVENPFQKNSLNTKSTNTGLKNLKARLHLLFNSEAHFEIISTNNLFSVQLIIPKEKT